MSTRSKPISSRMYRIFLSVFLLAVLATSLLPIGTESAAYADDDDTLGTIFGTLVGSDDALVTNAIIHAGTTSASLTNTWGWTPGGNGNFKIPESGGLPPGEYVLRFSGGSQSNGVPNGNHDDYYFAYYAGDGVVGMTPASDENFDVALTVTVVAGQETNIGTFVVPKKPVGSIQGNLVDGTDTPIANANVSAFYANDPNQPISQTQSDTNGDYNLKHLADGDYIVRFSPPYSSPELTSNYYNGALDGAALNAGDAVPITISSEDTHTGIDGKLYVGGSISGTVTDSSLNPLENASVTIYKKVPDAESPGGGFAYNFVNYLSTPGAGTYSVAGLAPGAYVVKFSGPNNDYVDQYYNGVNAYKYSETDESAATEISVSFGSVYTNIDAALLGAPAGSISGTVTDNETTGLDDATVELYSADGKRWLDNTSTDVSGNYEFENVPDGSYIVKFTAPYGSDLAPQYYDDADALADATLVVVGGGAATTGIDASLRIGGNISGVITDTNDSPLQNIFAVVFSKTPNGNNAFDYDMVGYEMSGTNGSYEITGLAPGKYCVVFLDLYGEQYLGQLYDNQNFDYDYSDEDALELIDFSPASEIIVGSGASVQDINAKLVTELPEEGNSIKITADKSNVNVGGSVVVSVGLYNKEGDFLEDVTNVSKITSDHATDIIAGNKVTFPSASTHIITAKYTGLSDSVSITVNPDVTPASTDTASGGDSPKTGDEMRPDLLIVICIVSIAALFVLFVKRRLPSDKE